MSASFSLSVINLPLVALWIGLNCISVDDYSFLQSQMTKARFTLVDPLSKGKGVLFADVAGKGTQEVTAKYFLACNKGLVGIPVYV